LAEPIHLRIFISSPGDVAGERDIVRALIKDALPVGEFQGKATFGAVSWDDPHASVATPAHLTPQQAVDLGLAKPSACDIVVVVLWSRMGTPLPAEYKKPSGEPYLSGTEWEYEDALAAARADGRPTILLYRRTQEPQIGLLASDFEEKKQQYLHVEAFFSQFRNEDGSLSGGFATYETPEAFVKLLEQHVRATVRRLIEPGKDLAASSAAPAFQSRIQAFLDEYLKSETGPVPFGGRDAELARLDAWLADETAPSRFLVTAPAGRGKSALLVRWIERLERTGRLGADSWKLVFVPISIRFGTNRQEVFYQALAERLAAVARQRLETPATDKAAYYADKVRDLLSVLADTAPRVLLVVDGLDEALRGEFDPTIVPRLLPPRVRILASARWLADDTDSTGWLKRLDWLFGVKRDSLELDALDDDAIGDVLVKMGAPLDAVADDPALIGRLAELTEGEPLLLRFYAADLWIVGSGTRITRKDLDTLKPGFGSYFDRWLDLQQKAWRDAGEAIDQGSVDAVLAILAFALGPLEGSNLLGLAMRLPGATPAFSTQSLLHPLQRFVIGDGSRDHGYVLSHPKIGEHLQTERFAAAAPAIRDTFVAWGREVVAAANQDPARPDRVPPYLLQFYGRHLQLADARTADFLALVRNGWRRAWEHYEGGEQGFASDVRAVWERTRKNEPLAELGTQLRCALTLSSIRSLAHNLPAELVIAAVEKNVLSVRQGLHMAGLMGDRVARVNTLGVLATGSKEDARQRQQILQDALAAAKAIVDESDRAIYLGALALHLDPTQRQEAMAAAKAIDDESNRARALGALAPHLDAGQLQDALTAAKAIGDAHSRAFALCLLAPHLDASQRQDALAAAKAIDAASARAEAVGALAPHLDAPQRLEALRDALAAAKAVGDKPARVRALSALVPHLNPTQRLEALRDALAAARQIGNPYARARALCAIAPHLDAVQRLEAIQEAWAAAKAIREPGIVHALRVLAPHLNSTQLQEALGANANIKHESARASVLGALAPHLDATQLQEALAAAKAIRHESDRALALLTLTPHLDTTQLQDVLAAAKGFGDESDRAIAFGMVACHLNATRRLETMRDALAAARAIRNEPHRADALGFLAPHLDVAQLQEALTAAKAIDDESARVRVMGALAPRLDATQLQDALAAAKAIRNESHRADALGFLAPHLDPTHFQDALAAAKAIPDEFARARALGFLAPHLDVPQLQDALVAANATGPDFARAELLTALAPHLDPSQLQDALAAAKDIDRESLARIAALRGLAPHLGPTQLQDALVAAMEVDNGTSRAIALGDLAPHLDAGQLQDALAAAKAIDHEHSRAFALRLLASHLDASQLQDALAAAKAIDDASARADAVGALATHLDAPQRLEALRDALAAAQAIGDKPARVRALSALVPHLNPTQRLEALRDALAVVKAIGHTEILGALAPHLDPRQLRDALAAAQAARFESDRAAALGALAPHLDATQLWDALTAAKAMTSESDRARALGALAPLLDVAQLRDVIAMGDSHSLAALAPHLDGEQRSAALAALLRIADRLTRPDLLGAIEPFVPIIAEIGGEEALVGLHDAIVDTATWYP